MCMECGLLSLRPAATRNTRWCQMQALNTTRRSWYGLINKDQHGFLSRRSTTTNLLETFDDWSLAINDRAFVITAYIDFSKAFDVVSHNKLLQKLAAYGIAGNLLSWIKNFLCSRSQMTRVGHSYSNVAYLCSGVKKLHWTVVICHLCE